MTRGWVAALTGVVAALTTVAACGDQDNVYVANDRAGVFVKLPSDWTTFQVKSADPTANPRTSTSAGEWSVILDGAEQPLRGHLEEEVPAAPVGMVQVIPTAMLVDADGAPLSLSNESLRKFMLNQQADPLDHPDVEVLEYFEIDLGHHWGSRLTATIQRSDTALVQMTQLAFVDSGGKRLYRFRLLCSVDCYAANEAEINAVLESWTLEAR